MKTAVVMNAGLGEMALSLEMAGFHVVAAYENDKQAKRILEYNLKTSVLPLSLDMIDVESVPDVDLLAARIHVPAFHSASKRVIREEPDSLHQVRELIVNKRPKAFFLLMNSSAANNELLHMFLRDSEEQGYSISFAKLDTNQETGAPVRERMLYVIGLQRGIEHDFKFPSRYDQSPLPIEKYLQLTVEIDPWYYQLRLRREPQFRGTPCVLCQDGQIYKETDIIRWNYQAPPLIHVDGTLRKITHREIARLKGIPDNYALFEETGRSTLYKKLIYAGNIQLIARIAKALRRALSKSSWQANQISRAIQFEQLFGRYLKELVNTANEKIGYEQGKVCDFTLRLGTQAVFFELKRYNMRTVAPHMVIEWSQRFSRFGKEGIAVLVIANQVSDSVKIQCKEQFGVFVWDTSNLLWLFDPYDEIKTEFIALLDYTVANIEPKRPDLEILQKLSVSTDQEQPPKADPEQAEEPPKEKETLSWHQKLQNIKPGQEQFRAYEDLCTEILKNTLGDYLTLWRKQQPSNDELYRFDLCCKIKYGANQDFFDTIKRHFNTKYIVFEFKNYSREIGQEEIYTTEKYLYEKALRKVAIIISRHGADKNAQKAAKGCLRENGKLILCLSDEDLMQLIEIKERGEAETAEYLSNCLDDLLVQLEK